MLLKHLIFYLCRAFLAKGDISGPLSLSPKHCWHSPGRSFDIELVRFTHHPGEWLPSCLKLNLKRMQSSATDPNIACVFKATRQEQGLGSFKNLHFLLLLNRDFKAGFRLSILHIEMIMVLYPFNTGRILQRKITEIEWGTEITLFEAS